LIEIVVSMAIIAMLSVLVVGAITVARNQALVTATLTEMRDIKGLFEAYSIKYGQYPPIGDCCSACSDPPSEGSWTTALNALKGAGMITDAELAEYQYDLWGTAYAYDDNLGQCYSCNNISVTSTFCSAGPDKRKGSINSDIDGYGAGDDICSNFKHEAICLWGCTP
jgi:type II secretory pathway pseudopilin PulG